MAIMEVHLRGGGALGRMTAFSVCVPEGKPGPFPVLYLLHGYSDDHTAWFRRTSIERYIENLPLIVVTPNSQLGWYTDAKEKLKENYETYIVSDLVGFVDATFHTIPERRGRALAGLSMGGYGAIKLALKHPDIFCAAHSFSGAVDMASHIPDRPSDWQREMQLVFGPNLKGSDNDTFTLIEQGDPATRPALSFDCGVDDFLLDQNRRFDAFLTEAGIPHIYKEYAGGHDWGYWDAHIQDALPWIMEQVGIQPVDGLSEY